MPKNGQDESKPQVPSAQQDAVPDAVVSHLHSIVDTPAQRGKQKVGEASPNLGTIPLFPNTKDAASAERAYRKALEFLKAEGIEIIGLDWLQTKLIAVAQRYWVEHERDARATSSDMKNEVARLQRDLAKVITRLGKLPMATRQELNAGVRAQLPKRNGPGPNYVAELHERSVLLHDACEPISSKKNTKVRRSHRFERCCADLWAVRERITGKPISQVFALHERTSFITDDAAFVHAIIEAINDKVTASQVQDGLRRAARAKKQRE